MTTARSSSTAPPIPLRPDDVGEWWVRMEDACLTCLVGSTCWFKFSADDSPFFGRVEDVAAREDGTFAIALAFGSIHDLEGSSLVQVAKRRRIEGFSRRIYGPDGRLSVVAPLPGVEACRPVPYGGKTGASEHIVEFWMTRQ